MNKSDMIFIFLSCFTIYIMKLFVYLLIIAPYEVDLVGKIQTRDSWTCLRKHWPCWNAQKMCQSRQHSTLDSDRSSRSRKNIKYSLYSPPNFGRTFQIGLTRTQRLGWKRYRCSPRSNQTLCQQKGISSSRSH